MSARPAIDDAIPADLAALLGGAGASEGAGGDYDPVGEFQALYDEAMAIRNPLLRAEMVAVLLELCGPDA